MSLQRKHVLLTSPDRDHSYSDEEVPAEDCAEHNNGSVGFLASYCSQWLDSFAPMSIFYPVVMQRQVGGITVNCRGPGNQN